LGFGEMQRVIAQREPLRPSTRLSTMANEERTTVARNRSMEAASLGRLFRGDLDWIVMKALEKDRMRRYDTASGLAMDVQRHLNPGPVIARPPSAAYRLQKLVRRHKAAVAGAAATTLALLFGLVVATISLIREHDARKRAERSEQRALTAETT